MIFNRHIQKSVDIFYYFYFLNVKFISSFRNFPKQKHFEVDVVTFLMTGGILQESGKLRKKQRNKQHKFQSKILIRL